ncbi:hypothetical protein G9Q38_00860 [Pusillimonas sp. DMV24BSW_D]|uniref:YtcA family lipoprotein n=1 Tax=Neopusillimonas aestuarii TaxID=2716226 RepID=UPI00140E6610|nr:YtcA family lipoprotein [Pusillimonas sp. DMV24BSW_D]QIM47829.1 hypothetical protein G9Q38_00860 [Pusillimonas sp. DMV24BSW_D]
MSWLKGIRLERVVFTLPVLLMLGGCSQGRAPSFLLFGSYFPSWLVGVAISIPLTLLVRWGLIRVGIDDVLPLRLLVYVCLGLIFTMMFAFLFSPR